MNKQQTEACERLAERYVFEENGHKFSNNNDEAVNNFESFKAGFQAAQTPERLILNPLVSELVRVLGMVTCVGSPYDRIINEALAPFKEGK